MDIDKAFPSGSVVKNLPANADSVTQETQVQFLG